MVKVNLSGCDSFVKDAELKNYIQKALAAYDILDAGSGAGNDFLGWKALPDGTPEELIAGYEAVRDDWYARGINLVVVIGIGGSYLGARCALEALNHQFILPEGKPRVVFAGNNLSEDYLAEMKDLADRSTVA